MASAKSSVFVLSIGMLVGCSPGPAADLTIADILPVVTPLTYRELIGTKCGEPNIAVKTVYLAELKAAGASAKLMGEAEAEAAKIEAAERDTPNEYVCTAELFESTEKNAAEAQKVWADLKTRKS